MAKEKFKYYNKIDLNAKSKTQKELVDEVAATIGIHPNLAMICIQSYLDICTREIVKRGRLVIPGFLGVVSLPYNPDPIKYKDKGYIKFPPTTKLQVKLSRKLLNFYRWARRYEESNTFGLNPEDWWKPFAISDEEAKTYKKYRWKNTKEKLENILAEREEEANGRDVPTEEK